MPSSSHWASLVAQTVKRLPAVQEGATHSSTLAWKIPWVEEPGGLQSMGSQRVGHDFTFTFTLQIQKSGSFRHHRDPYEGQLHTIIKLGN